MDVAPDDIARLCITTFSNLPKQVECLIELEYKLNIRLEIGNWKMKLKIVILCWKCPHYI